MNNASVMSFHHMIDRNPIVLFFKWGKNFVHLNAALLISISPDENRYKHSIQPSSNIKTSRAHQDDLVHNKYTMYTAEKKNTVKIKQASPSSRTLMFIIVALMYGYHRLIQKYKFFGQKLKLCCKVGRRRHLPRRSPLWGVVLKILPPCAFLGWTCAASWPAGARPVMVARVASSFSTMMMASSAESRQGFGCRLFPACLTCFFFVPLQRRGVRAALEVPRR